MRTIILSFILFISCSLVSAKNNFTEDQTFLSPTEIKVAIKNLIKELDHTYVHAENTSELSNELLKELNSVQYQHAFDETEFIRKFRLLVVSMTHDKNIELSRIKDVHTVHLETAKNTTSPNNSAPISTNILADNIGHLKMTGYLTASHSQRLIKTAFKELTNVDALIIDLREAEGTTIPLVQLILSYFLPAETHFANIHLNEEIIPLKTIDTGNNHFIDNNTPVYILNTAFTEGPWELLSYILKQAEKALILGEDTMGQKYLMKSVAINKRLSVTLPFALMTSPVSEESWDGGISADISVARDKAMDEAYKLAKQAVVAN